jgi:serine/threonine protein phosphatase 1
MVKRLLDRILPPRSGAPATRSRPKLFFDHRPDVIYAIGDVHGCHSLLLKLEQSILRDAATVPGEKWIVLLGDYVDRGPASAAVLAHLLSPVPAGFKRVCLAGNHEGLMLSYLDDPDPGHFWLGLGGRDTLHSYGIDNVTERRSSMKALLEHRVPSEHVDFLRTAPSLLSVPHFTFVHGGIRPGIPLAQQVDQDLLWLRPDLDKAKAAPADFVTIHGHTPIRNVALNAGRVNVDTGAYATGILSCVRIDRGNRISKLSVS